MTSSTAVLPTRIELADGLVGLPLARSFEVRPVPSGELIELVSLDDPDLGFVAAPADAVRAGYTFELASTGLAGPGSTILVLLAVHGDPPTVTANLAGPLLVDPDGSGHQLVLDGARFPLHEPVGAEG